MSLVLFQVFEKKFFDVGKFLDLLPLSGLDGFTVVKKSTTVVTSMPQKTGAIIALSPRKKQCCKKLKPRHAKPQRSSEVIRKPRSVVKAKDTLALLSNERDPKMERMIIPTIAASILGSLGAIDMDAAPRDKQAIEAPANVPTLAYYTVRKGDTVSHIIKRFGMSLSDFKRLNPEIKDLDKIKIGDEVKVVEKNKQATQKKDSPKKYKPSEYDVTDLALKAIKTWESHGKENKQGLLVPYYDKVGKVWTIGYGTTYYPDGRKVGPNDKPITKKEAEGFLKNYLNKLVNRLKQKSKTELTEGQLAALLSFGYNVGGTRLAKLCDRYLSKNKPEEALNYMKQFIYAGGEESRGLARRREREEILWNTGKIISL